jgi:hypothetical protein
VTGHHVECVDCGKCRDVKVADTWCVACEDWSCERGEDCADKPAGIPPAVFGVSPSGYGHVEVVTRRQAWAWRLAGWRHRAALVFGWLRGNR